MQTQRFIALFISLVATAPPESNQQQLNLGGTATIDVINLPGSPVWMGRTPVTNAQFRRFVEETDYRTDAENPKGNGPGRVGGHGWNEQLRRFQGWFPQYTWRHTGWPTTAEHPVSNVSWNDAQAFCLWLTKKTGRKVRLPSEKEWDRAARAGAASVFFTGVEAASLHGYANVADQSLREKLSQPDDGSGFRFNDGYAFTSPVGSYKPNPLGLSDMLGNVFQWCVGTAGPKLCGCSYNDGPKMCSEARGDAAPHARYAYFGFRIVVDHSQ